MSIHFDTFEDALKHFIRFVERNKPTKPDKHHRGDTLVKSYRIGEHTGVFRQYCGKKRTYPRFKWRTNAPEGLETGEKALNRIKRYLTPFVVQERYGTHPQAPKPLLVDEKPADVEFGQVVHKTDTSHYQKMMERLLDNNPFEVEDKEQSND